jgi:hypothetical protein
MKKLLYAGAALLVASAVGVALARHSNQYKQAQAAQAVQSQAAAEAAAKTQATKAESAQVVAWSNAQKLYATVKAECLKGKTAYDKLAPALKNQIPAPNCGQPELQPAVGFTSPNQLQ